MVGCVRYDDRLGTDGRQVCRAERAMVAIALPGRRDGEPQRFSNRGEAAGQRTERRMALSHVVQQQSSDRRLISGPDHGYALCRLHTVSLISDGKGPEESMFVRTQERRDGILLDRAEG